MAVSYNIQRDRLFGKPSIKSRYCPFCGRMATNEHHIIQKGMGGTKREKEIPTVTVCGWGNTSGCHGKIHEHLIEIDWDDETGWWRYRYTTGTDTEWKAVRTWD